MWLTSDVQIGSRNFRSTFVEDLNRILISIFSKNVLDAQHVKVSFLNDLKLLVIIDFSRSLVPNNG
jgi:hypothetical protein